MSFQSSLDKVLQRHKDLASRLEMGISGEDFVATSKEYSDLEPKVSKIIEYKEALKDLESVHEMESEEDLDPDMKEWVKQEISLLNKKISCLEKEVKTVLLPKDESDDKSAIIEIRAGTGGEEASLFAADLFSMYHKYCLLKGWKFEVLSISEIGIGGYKEASALVTGKGAFGRMKYESGVHRVQRVPDTESSGRIHTSAATVAVLPETHEVDLKIDEKDIRIDTYRASGSGGQHVNTTDSAVRVTHIPTGVMVAIQDEKSQHKNKAKALKLLRSRLYDARRQELDNERSQFRKNQIGSGDRSERVRTYNFPQGRVSDHRINLTLYKIDEITKEGKIDEFINALILKNEEDMISSFFHEDCMPIEINKIM